MYLLVISPDSRIESTLKLNKNCFSRTPVQLLCPREYDLGYYLNPYLEAELCESNRLNCRDKSDCNICSDINCLNCTNSRFFGCASCINSFLYGGYCYMECPLFTTQISSNECQLSNDIYSLSFAAGIKTIHQSFVLSFSGSGIPIYVPQRGMYFPQSTLGTSYPSYYLMPEITQFIWMKVIDSGLKIVGFSGGINYEFYSFQINYKDRAMSLNIPVDFVWKVLIKTTKKGNSNGLYADSGKGILYTHTFFIDYTLISSITFYDHSTSQERQMMNFIIKTETFSTALIYYYGITAIPNYNPSLKTIENNIVLEIASTSELSKCSLSQYILNKICFDCNCIGCTISTICPVICKNNCATCLSVNLGDCLICKSGFKLLNGLCLINCPFLYNSTNDMCTYNTQRFIAEWNFHSLSYPIVSQGISMELNDTGYFQYKRGWYSKKNKS